MRSFFNTLLYCFCFVPVVSAQEQKEIGSQLRSDVETVLSTPIDSATIEKTKSVGKNLYNEIKDLKDTINLKAGNIKIDTIPSQEELKKIAQDRYQKVLEEKIPGLQYNSDNRENAPWKSMDFSEEDLSNFSLRDLPVDEALPFPGDKPQEYREKLENLKPSTMNVEKVKEEIDKVTQSIADEKLNKATHAIDSLYALKNKLEAFNLQQELLNARRIYSDKYIRKYMILWALKRPTAFFR
jgi:hypothetical protein